MAWGTHNWESVPKLSCPTLVATSQHSTCLVNHDRKRKLLPFPSLSHYHYPLSLWWRYIWNKKVLAHAPCLKFNVLDLLPIPCLALHCLHLVAAITLDNNMEINNFKWCLRTIPSWSKLPYWDSNFTVALVYSRELSKMSLTKGGPCFALQHSRSLRASISVQSDQFH